MSVSVAVIFLALTAAFPRSAPGGPPSAETPLKPGIKLPDLEGTLLTGKKARLPDVSRGKITLLALGFTYNSRTAVGDWCRQFEERFAGRQDVTFYEIPIIGGAARMARWFIDRGMRNGTPKDRHENVLTVYGNVTPWKERISFNSPDDAYLILLDRQGIVRWLHAGPFNDADFSRLAEAVRNLDFDRSAVESVR